MTLEAKMRQLTYKQRKLITALLSCPTEQTAAKMAGISERTIIRWMALPHFRDELRAAGIDASQRTVGATMRRLTEGQAAALSVLEDVMQSGNANERRLAAANWLTIYRDYKEVVEFDERLEKLEKETGK
jgi:transcriptional regulator NrdR family protein